MEGEIVTAESIPEETSQDRQDNGPKQEDQTPEERIRIEHASAEPVNRYETRTGRY